MCPRCGGVGLLESGMLFENEESPMPRSYPPEFRRRVIDLVESGRPVAEVAADLGVSDQTVYNWWNQHLTDSRRKSGVSSTDNAELAAAHKRIAELETELAAARRASELLKAVVPQNEVLGG